jgi:hypothetical protein
MKSYKSIFSKLAIVAFFLFSSGNFLFGQTQPIYVTTTSEDIKIKFAGLDGEMLVFEVELQNLPVKGTSLSISDDQNNILFEERILKTSHTCRYKIAGTTNMGMITFKVSGKTILVNQSFTINYKIEERLEVKKV